MFLDLFGNGPDSADYPAKSLSGTACMKVPPFCMKLIRPTRRIGNPGPIWAWISFAGIQSGDPEKVSLRFPLPCPNTILAPFGFWLIPVNVFRSRWKQPGFPDYRIITPFRKHVYESTPVLHEIDPGHLPDWQSGPVSGPDLPQ